MGGSAGIPFGSYELLKRLARGGMAEVFLGRQKGPQGFDRLVAVKRVLPHLTESEEFINMFFDEARLAARLSHPNCVHIYEFGKVGEDYFIAMEYVHGVHSGELIMHAANEAIPCELIARIGADACAGLHHAHEVRDERGRPLDIVHRDVSPPNLLISYEGTIKLVDFGIAKAAISVEQTRPGIVKGKYAYMSPEQTVGKKLTPKSDVFSLAMVLWEMLAGRVAVSRFDKVAAMKMIRDGQLPRLERFRPDVPAALSMALSMALVLDPEQRVTALELKTALEEYLKNQPQVVSSIELSQWISDRFPWESPTGDQEVDNLLNTRSTFPGSASVAMGSESMLAAADSLMVGGDSIAVLGDSVMRADSLPLQSASLAASGEFLVSDSAPRSTIANFPPGAPTIPSPPPEVDLEATLIADGPPTPQDVPRPTLSPGEDPRAQIDAKAEAQRPHEPTVTSVVGTIGAPTATTRRAPPNPRLRRIALVAGAAVVLGLAVIFGFGSGDSPAVATDASASAALPQVAQAAGAEVGVASRAPVTEPAAPRIVAAPDAGARSATDAAAPVTSGIEVVTRPETALVRVDELPPQPSPARFEGLAPGTHRIRIVEDGYHPVDRVIALEPGERKSLQLSLVPASTGSRPRRPAGPGQLVARTVPYTVAFLDGRKFDTTPFTRSLKPGRYTFVFKHPGYPPHRRRVTIRPGHKTKVFFELKK